ncbi:MAG: hypothetical protein IJ341_12220 [Bacteroidales bacterium]|nr:hypothetical protein [Bacteroidales bacterium]
MSKFSVYCDPQGMKELCELSPYNLKKDLKPITEDELNRILEDVANELYQGVDRPPASSMLYWHRLRKAGYAKIRVVDIQHDDGKSNGYRCVTLVDMINHRAFVLHIYKHGKGKDDKITDKAAKQLRNLVDEYVDSL